MRGENEWQRKRTKADVEQLVSNQSRVWIQESLRPWNTRNPCDTRKKKVPRLTWLWMLFPCNNNSPIIVMNIHRYDRALSCKERENKRLSNQADAGIQSQAFGIAFYARLSTRGLVSLTHTDARTHKHTHALTHVWPSWSLFVIRELKVWDQQIFIYWRAKETESISGCWQTDACEYAQERRWACARECTPSSSQRFFAPHPVHGIRSSIGRRSGCSFVVRLVMGTRRRGAGRFDTRVTQRTFPPATPRLPADPDVKK